MILHNARLEIFLSAHEMSSKAPTFQWGLHHYRAGISFVLCLGHKLSGQVYNQEQKETCAHVFT